MASAQVLKKQEHLEAGKKKLEEFRRKKAAEKAKRIASTNQSQSSGGVQNEKQTSESDGLHIKDSQVVVRAEITKEDFNVSNLVEKESDITMDGLKNPKDELMGRNDSGGLKDIPSDTVDSSVVSTSDDLHWNSFRSPLSNNASSIRQEDSKMMSSPYPESLHSTPSVNHSSPERKLPLFSNVGEEQSGGASHNIVATNYSSPWTAHNGFSSFNSEPRSSSNLFHASLDMGGRQSRPSFLDSIQKSGSPSPPVSLFGAGKVHAPRLNDSPADGFESFSKASANSSASNGDVPGLFNHALKNDADIYVRRQNEDFAALEQHIEDLTLEKFSLQRALEASRVLANSLASENSTLSESFNQQGSIVNQLKLDLEKLQEEINFHMVELEALKVAYSNAQMECSASDERAKLLASEVIELEEKALRLRSNELKLERQLENFQAEISSYRKKISSLEKDREDSISTINALQEEKKLMQTKLRNASGKKSVDLDKTAISKKDVATSTENLDSENNAEYLGFGAHRDESTSSQDSVNLSLEGLPMDHKRIISNINTLIAEVALEKDHLMQALSEESSRSSTMLELNKELTKKLEVQTQRLELLTAQSLAGDIRQQKQLDHRTYENPTYADEGDEVVERVLGWIMKLFPGGPSRRRHSTHL